MSSGDMFVESGEVKLEKTGRIIITGDIFDDINGSTEEDIRPKSIAIQNRVGLLQRCILGSQPQQDLCAVNMDER